MLNYSNIQPANIEHLGLLCSVRNTGHHVSQFPHMHMTHDSRHPNEPDQDESPSFERCACQISVVDRRALHALLEK